MKKIPMYPPLSACLSVKFAQLEGKVISNAPKNEIAKIIKMTKKPKLTHGFVANSFKAEAPNNKVAKVATPIKITTIESPYTKALTIPCPRSLLCFVNKLTVKGIIGNIQGITNANKPPDTPNKNVAQRLELFESSVGVVVDSSEILVVETFESFETARAKVSLLSSSVLVASCSSSSSSFSASSSGVKAD